jgi:hypothetical protein
VNRFPDFAATRLPPIPRRRFAADSVRGQLRDDQEAVSQRFAGCGMRRACHGEWGECDRLLRVTPRGMLISGACPRRTVTCRCRVIRKGVRRGRVVDEPSVLKGQGAALAFRLRWHGGQEFVGIGCLGEIRLGGGG